VILAWLGAFAKQVHALTWLRRSLTISPATGVLLPHSVKLSAAALIKAEVTLDEIVVGLRRGA
jgi:hypothetical protein